MMRPRLSALSPMIAMVSIVTSWSLLAGCGSKSSNRDALAQPVRKGGELAQIGAQYSDYQPSFNYAGDKLVFVSGRETTASKTFLKIYKVEWLANGVPGEPLRLTPNNDLENENAAVISPDGQWVVVRANKAGQTDLYLVDFTSKKSPVRLTEDPAVESHIGFSPDSKLLTYISANEQDGRAEVILLAIGDGSAGGLADKKKITPADEWAQNVFFLPASAGYRLGLVTAKQGVAAGTPRNLKFADLASAATAKLEDLVKEPFKLHPAVTPVASETKLLVARQNVSSANRTSVRGGDVIEAAPATAAIVSEPVVIDLASGSTSSFEAPLGFETLALGLTKDSSQALWLARTAYRCEIDNQNTRYGTTLVMSGANLTTPKVFSLREGVSEGSFEMAGDFCNRKRADGSLGRLDDKIIDLQVNGAAVAGSMRVIYVSRFSRAYDETCLLKTGDPEIMGMQISGEAVSIYPISKNRVKLDNSPRPAGEEPCKPE